MLLLVCLLAARCLLAQQWLVVDSIAIKGLRRTNPGVILREMAFQAGDTVRPADLDSLVLISKQNVYNLGLFNRVDMVLIEQRGRYQVVVELKERWYIFPTPYLASEERTSYDFINSLKAGRLPLIAYGGVLVWRNMLGNNETLNFFGQTGFSQRLYLDFTRPALFPKQRIDFAIGVSYIGKKNTIYGTDSAQVMWARQKLTPVQQYYGGYVWFRKRFTPRSSMYVRLQYRQFALGDSLHTFPYGEEYLTHGRKAEAYPGLILGYESDRRDIRTYPMQGYRLHAVARYAGMGLGSVQFLKAGFAWSHHLPLSPRWNVAYGLQAFGTLGKNLPFIEKSFLGLSTGEFQGYNEILRGYQPYIISGTQVATAKAEVKFALLRRRIVHVGWVPHEKFKDLPLGIYLTAFADGGYVHDGSATNRDTYFRDRPLLGYGFGINLIGPYDLMGRLEYAWNHTGQGGLYVHMTVPIP